MKEYQIVEEMKEGSKEAFDLLYAEYKNKLFRMAVLILGNQTDAQDVVQETFVKCFLNCRNLKDSNGFRAWIFTILTRTAWQYGKKSHYEIPDEEVESRVEKYDEKTTLDRIIDKEKSQKINYMIHSLDIKHRTVIVYYYYNQMSTKEIAKICGCLEGTVKSRLFHARNQLKQKIQKLEQEELYEQTTKRSRKINCSSIAKVR